MERTRFFRRPVVWIILVIVGAIALSSLFTGGGGYTKVDTSAALAEMQSGGIKKAVIADKEQTIRLDLGAKKKFGDNETDKIEAQFPAEAGSDIWNKVQQAKAENRVTEAYDTSVTKDSVFLTLLVNLLPIALFAILLLLFISQMQGGGSRVLNFGKSKAKMISKDMPKTTFSDVAGCDEAVQELHEIKDFLQNPAKYQALGAKIPKGVLLFGQPGTGKTLLARAVAGEAGVPFYSISGSDFVEMDGFDTKGGVILIAATNRPDILDPALLRPGRFDRQIAVDTPDMEGRKAILRVHAKGKPFSPDVDLDSVARRTPGFTGADLANVINESALLTARNDKRAITNYFLEEAIDRVIAGPERRTRAMSDHEKKITAYHEAGHALVAWALTNLPPVHKVTILPRGRSLGHTLVLPTEDKYTQTRAEMIDTLAYALGGRAAEELVFHEPTTGAGDDINKATNLARAMVTQFGMSSKLGAVKYGTNDSEPFLGRNYGHERDYSDSVAAEIDTEVRALIELAHDEAWEILVEYRDVLDNLVLELIEKETVSQQDMARLAARVQKRPPMAPYNGFGKRQPSDLPPVLTPSEKDALKVQAQKDGAEAHSGGPAAGTPKNGAAPAPKSVDLPSSDAPTSEGAR